MTEFIQLPPDGSGKRIVMKAHTNDGVVQYAQVVHIGSGDDDNDEHLQFVDNRGAANVRFAEGQPIFNAFNRLKTTDSYIIGVYEHSIDGYDDLFWVDEENGGTSTYDSVVGCVVLTASGQLDSLAQRTTNRYHYYQQGNSMLYLLTVACGDDGHVGNVRRWGAFDDNNGRFFELDGDTFSVVARGDTYGVIQEIRVAQDDWNVDKLDGTGLSGVDLDVTKTWTYWIDIGWPAVNTRFGVFDTEGNRVVCHRMNMAGDRPFAFSRSGSFPVRFSNWNREITGVDSVMRELTAVVFSEGNPSYTFWRYGGMIAEGRTVGDHTPVLSVRSKVTLPTGVRNTVNAFPETLSCFVSGGPIRIELVSHSEASALLTDATWAVDNYSTLDGDAAATAIDTEDEDYWNFTSFFVGEGIQNIDLRPYYELNDEGILLAGDGSTRGCLSFVCTALDPQDTPLVTLELSTRELW